MLNEICMKKTDLPLQAVKRLEELSCQLPLIAELTGTDVFVDCMTIDGGVVVAAQASPATVASAYKQSVVGQYVFRDREPAVFHAFELKTPVRDLKAITQEDRAVRQNVVPILMEDRCIAVLISEKDISAPLRREKKFQHLAHTYEEQDLSLRSVQTVSDNVLSLREIHHRVKNDLQLVASILNIQSRRCEEGPAKKILQENVSRVLSIAAIHDILTKKGADSSAISSILLLKQLGRNLQTLVPDGRMIDIRITGDDVVLPSDTAGALSIVVNELITNALEHAFENRDKGEIVVSFCAGSMFHTVTVSDNGIGFDVLAPWEKSFGMRIVDATVRDRLHGQLSISSGAGGTRFSFDIKIE